MVHPSQSTLRQLLEDELEGSVKSDVEDHVDNCEACQAQLESLETTIDSIRPLMENEAQSRTESTSPLQHEAIDRYTLIAKIGEGGMGEVWRAEQTDPVRRQVALKLIRMEHADDHVITRFEGERQALAMMNHPNIAKALDAGTTKNGMPYFVMELVPGLSVTKYCDRNNLTLRERLTLFRDICDAIQHAHHKGIIHRDLKPSNVLVHEVEGKPIVKVIDFGLAKALERDSRLTDRTLETEVGRVLGTLQYMSPEQATAEEKDTDSRTDIYALGVLLYELLTGSTPITRKAIGNKSLVQALELIRDYEPHRPSYRLDKATESVNSICASRQIRPSKLLQILRGDLDWIVMKGIESDRKRRYSTASEFAEDLKRSWVGNRSSPGLLPGFIEFESLYPRIGWR